MSIAQLKIREDLDYPSHVKQLFRERYMLTDVDGEPVETISGVWHRVAYAVALADVNYSDAKVVSTGRDFYRLLASGAFLPNTPAIMNAGRPDGQLCGCFLLRLEDDANQQLDTIRKIGMIHKAGGGTGFSFSRIRPQGDRIRSGGKAYGFLPLAQAIDCLTAAFKQSGRRRGANMGTMLCSHPEIGRFIACKDIPGQLENFNFSVMVTDRFMDHARSRSSTRLVNPRTGQITLTDASTLLQSIAERAWQSGEPGLIFRDTMNESNPCPEWGEIDCTNPCGEVPLPAPAICNLGSINLTKCWIDGGFDWNLFREIVHTAIHFLDNMIDVNHNPFPEFDEFSRATRAIGLGVMGWADLLLLKQIPYNSDDAVNFAEELASSLFKEANEASSKLAEQRGIYQLQRSGDRRRNAMLLSIAPTGTIALLAGECSGGIEPVYSWTTTRRILTDNGYTNVATTHPEAASFSYSPGRAMKKPEWLVCCNDISPQWHLQHQAVWQKYIDGSISKTINLPRQATVEEVLNIYTEAHKLGCKGVTVYRDGSRAGQILSKCPDCLVDSCSTNV